MTSKTILSTTLLLFILTNACAAPVKSPLLSAHTSSGTSTPFNTPTLQPSKTKIPIPSTPTTSQIDTSTPTPTNAPDNRVIAVSNPSLYLPDRRDLPAEAQYYIPNSGWASPQYNQEVVWDWGAAKANEYIKTTGRLMGWWVSYARGTLEVYAPDQLDCEVIAYKDNEGARLAVTNYNAAVIFPDKGWKQVLTNTSLGDVTSAESLSKVDQGGMQQVSYRIEFAYRNYVGSVTGSGWPEDVKPELLAGVAQTILNKLQSAAPASTTHIPAIIPIVLKPAEALKNDLPVKVDDRTIVDDLPAKFLVKINDLPKNAGYFIPQDGYSPVANAEIISNFGMKLGRKIVASTGRISGWNVKFERSGLAKEFPSTITADVNLFRTTAGALKAVSEFNPIMLYPDQGWKITQTLPASGDIQVLIITSQKIPSQPGIFQSRAEFAYRNYQGIVSVTGTAEQTSNNFLLGLTNFMLKRMERAPLSAQPGTLLPTPIPGSEKIIIGEPKDFVLQLKDLPSEAGYYLPESSWFEESDKPVLNSEIISDWGIKLGREYVISTGRQSGYQMEYLKGKVNSGFPNGIYCEIIKFQNSSGPRQLFEDYSDVTRSPYDGWDKVNTDLSLGDMNQIFTQYQILNSGRIYRWYEIEYAYRNFIVRVYAWGYENEVKHDFIEKTAQIILKRLQNAPTELAILN